MNNTFCKNCGAPIQPGMNVCPSCGTPLMQQQPMMNQQPMGQQMYRPMPQQPYGYQQPAQPSQDTGSIGWAVLGFLFPLVGWILYFVWKDTKPKSAKMAGIGGLVGFVINIVLYATGAVKLPFN